MKEKKAPSAVKRSASLSVDGTAEVEVVKEPSILRESPPSAVSEIRYIDGPVTFPLEHDVTGGREMGAKRQVSCPLYLSLHYLPNPCNPPLALPSADPLPFPLPPFSAEVTFASSTSSSRSGAKFSEVKLSAEQQKQLQVNHSLTQRSTSFTHRSPFPIPLFLCSS